MKKPEELIELLSALRGEIRSSSALVEDDSHVAVFIGRGTLNLDANEAAMILHSVGTVARFFEALGSSPGMAIEISNIAIDEDVKEALDERFSTVDEL